MAAGHRVYSFDWAVFADLTSNAESDIPAALAGTLLDGKTRQKLKLPSGLPKSHDKLSALVRDLFLGPEWYVDQPSSDVKLRHQLLSGMFFDETLKPIGLSAMPAWREFHECCAFDLAHLLAGRSTLDLDRMKSNGGAYFKRVDDAEPGDNAFWWFGNRPHRHGAWQGSNEDMRDFEEEYDWNVYSIQSPDDVNSLAGRLAEESRRCERVKCEELRDMFSDYEHCIEAVKKKRAGMFVENDY